MYQKPDFIKVSVKVNDVFANYSSTGCPADERGMWTYTIPCEGTENYHYVEGTMVSLGLASQCYTTLAP